MGLARGGTLMRHFRALAVAALALGMSEATAARALVASSGLTLGVTMGGFRARLAAVAVAPVTVAANHHLASAPGTIEQTRAAAHRRLLPMSAGRKPTGERYSPKGRAAHGLGRGIGVTVVVVPDAAPVSTA